MTVVIHTIVAIAHRISPTKMEVPSEREASVHVPASPMRPKVIPKAFSGIPGTADG
ncbi:hypothetical protein Pth03_74010 [Planotetraspora thailandica]|uniref:Uncharacterized protein n=1 Tax=Planotetraspora thailandica TaxID=487172 RepID=A0A8J4DFJ9_9ACTN|nr:hypothetical protein Pth03_74010 [Planotetraspora thailandica]